MSEHRSPCLASCKTDTDVFPALSPQAQSSRTQDGGVSGTQCDTPTHTAVPSPGLGSHIPLPSVANTYPFNPTYPKVPWLLP